MSTSPADNGRRKVVVPNMADRSGINWLRVLPIWCLSFVVHIVMLVAFTFITFGSATAEEAGKTKVVQTTEVEEQQKDADLTNTDIGVDDTQQTNFNVDRIEEVSVPGPAPSAGPRPAGR